jgi:hypothetical protein
VVPHTSPINLNYNHILGKKMVGLIMALKTLHYFHKHLKTTGFPTIIIFGKNLPKGNVKKIMN